MSAAARAVLASAASTVEGVTGHPYYVQTTAAGTAWIRLDRTEYPNRFGGVEFYNVVLLLPQDQAAAEEYVEAKVPLLREALDPHLVITSYTPQRIQLDGLGTLPAVFINGHREEE